MDAFGIDIGGSGIKGAPVDLSTGSLAAQRLRIKTPRPATPGAVADAVDELIASHRWKGPVGITVPGIVRGGTVLSAANIHHDWISLDAADLFHERLGMPVTVLNDADAAGIAEMSFGAGADVSGVVLLLTFGTGIGSALFVDGTLVPNTELGHLEFKGGEAEQYAAGRLVKREEMSISWWARRVNDLLNHLELLFSPDLFIIGGGISKRFGDFSSYLDTRARIVPAELRNNAGIVGAAMRAAQEQR